VANPIADILRVTSPPGRHFFGYYEKCPWNASGTRMLAHRVDFDERPPGADDEAHLGIIHLDEGTRWETIGETRAWNFQQGAMLQWVGPDADRFVLYNIRDQDRFAAMLLDLETGERRHLSQPVSTISPDGRFALSLNFARLADVSPGYGYAGPPDPWADVNCPEDDGIYLLDLRNGSSRLLVSTAQVVGVGDGTPGAECKHWVNHTLFNPDGTRFSFVHRWATQDGSWHTRLFTCSTDGADLYCLCDTGTVSHYDWRDPSRLLAWARKKQNLSDTSKRKLVGLSASALVHVPPFSWAMRIARQTGAIGWVRQRMVGDRFILFTDRTPDAEDIGVGVLAEDGHCSYSPDRRWILMDTYPHEDHHRILLLYDTKHQRRIEVGRFFSQPELTGEIRCDLHARWNQDGTKVCIDSSHEGGRQVFVLDVADCINDS
jgi:hypothetical protein